MADLKHRREFLKKIAIGSIGLSWMPQLLASPYQNLITDFSRLSPIRIFGKVKEGNKGIAGVSISDGYDVVQTSADGTFEFSSSIERPFVWMSPPSGYEIPIGNQGIASCYRPIQPGKDSQKVEWAINRSKVEDTNHGFLVMADTQTLDKEDMRRFQSESIPDSIKTISESNLPLFNLSCGDIMWDNLELFNEYKNGIEQLGIPSFQVVGNHDLDFGSTDKGSIATFMSHFGPGYYSFNRGEVHYVVLDDVFWFGNGYMGYIDEIQYKWLENDLKFVENGKTVVVFTHIPVYDQQYIRDGQNQPRNSVIVTNRDRLYRILEPYQAHIISGHMHTNNSYTDGGATHHNCGAVCGGWWTGDICTDGTPNGYAVYEIKGSSLSWKYKSTGKPFEHQMRIYGPGSDPLAPDEMVANVWDVRENSAVFWFEDGIRKGKMAQRKGQDPDCVRLLEGSNKPAKHDWVDPGNTSHLFYAPISEEAGEIIVEFNDGHGNVYSEKL